MTNKLTDIQEIILGKIKKYEKISLFFHVAPDFDALGSCFTLYQYIIETYPDKDVNVIGMDIVDGEYFKNLYPYDNKFIPDSFIKESLGIICDTANEPRINSMRHKLCNETIRIDHHPPTDKFCTTEWIQPMAPATVQMIAEMLINSGYKISPTVAKYIYGGLITDTNRFLHYNTNPYSYKLASILLNTGFNRKEVHDAVYKVEQKELYMNTYVVKNTKIENGVAYAIIPLSVYKKYGIDIQYSYVASLANIKGVYIWTTIYFDSRYKIWRGSIRSDDIPINHIAEKYNGGGHKFAAGFSIKSTRKYKELVNDLKEYLESIQTK